MKNIDEELNEVQRFFSEGDYQLALRKINKLVKNNKKNYIVYNYKGIILVALKKSSEAIENFKKTLEINPGFAEAIGNMGMAYHEMNYIARAAIPMFLIMVLMVFVLITFPDLATWLPENVRARPGG